ncbi:T9SS type A sorting domain-containing protein [Bacteroidota bacterium]
MKKILLFIFLTIIFSASAIQAQPTSIDVEDTFDFQLAIKYATGNNVDTIYLSTPGGLYTTTDTLYYHITSPLVIMTKPGITEMPTITHSDDSADVLEMFRISDDLTIQGVIFDGSHEVCHGMKYALRAGDGPDGFPVHKTGLNITVKDCIFKNIYQDKDLEAAGHGLYFLKGVEAGTVKIENCTFENLGDEAIRMSETEKFETERVVDTLIVRNCSFTNMDSECVRFYADMDTSTTDAYVLIENITINNCSPEAMYIKNNQYTAVKNIIISNGRLPGSDRMDRGEFLIEVQQKGSYITNVDTFNCVYVGMPKDRLRATKGAIGVIEGTAFDFDPLYEDASSNNYALQPSSPAHYSGENNKHLGDLRWASNSPNVSPLNVEIIGEGEVTFNPERVGFVFPTGTEVTVTAVADSGWDFIEWGGDLSGTDNPTTIVVDGIKNISASFHQQVSGVNDNILELYEYNLGQNFPNPFNPTTAISFTLKKEGYTTLKIFNSIGQEVSEIVNTMLKAGPHNVYIDGSKLASGVYYYQLSSGEFLTTKKMILLK